MKQTTNYNLVKPELTDSPPDITVMNPNWDKIDAKLRANEEQIENLAAYGVASGTNTYVATIIGITALTEGFTVRIKFTNANTGASTLNINSLGAKAIVKSNGASLSSGNIKAGQICNLAYTGSNFQLLGEGGEYGTATDSDVLSGKTIGTEVGLVTGTMPNRGAVNQNLTAEGQEYTIPSGYHNGLGKVKAVITGLVANVIAMGATVGGIAGSFTSDATATAAQMLSGAIAYVNGNKITGTIPSKGAQTYTPGTTNQTIAASQYLSGAQTIAGSANLIAGNIKKDVNIFGVVGTYLPIPRKTLVTFTSSTSWTVPTGCYEIEVYMIGGGAGGQAGTPGQITGYTSGGGGASGRIYSGVFPITSGVLNITVGAGGAAQSYSTSMTYNGTNSTITGAITASTASGSQASAVSGTTNQVGANGTTLSTNFPSELQQAVYGGGAGGGLYNEDGRAGGTSAGGGNGGYGQDSSNPTGGSPATLYGCGGGGGGRNYRAVSPSGGAGKSGIVYIYYLSIE